MSAARCPSCGSPEGPACRCWEWRDPGALVRAPRAAVERGSIGELGIVFSCARCGHAVEHQRVWIDPAMQRTVYVVRCHGEEERHPVDDAFWMMVGPRLEGLEIVPAFADLPAHLVQERPVETVDLAQYPAREPARRVGGSGLSLLPARASRRSGGNQP